MYYNNQELTHECYCPCGKIHSSWLDNMKIKDYIIDESLCQKLCHINKFNNPKDLLGYLIGIAQASSPCFVHYGLSVYLEQSQHPEQKLKTKMRNRKNIEKQNNSNQKQVRNYLNNSSFHTLNIKRLAYCIINVYLIETLFIFSAELTMLNLFLYRKYIV